MIVAVSAVIVRSHAFRANPAIVSWGVTFDLTITLPAIYWLLIVRSGRARPLTIAPVFVLCAALAAMLLPREQQSFLHQLRLVAVPLDVISIVLLVRKIAEIRRTASASADGESRIQHAARALFGDNALGAAVGSELSIVYYALFCWRKQPQAEDDCQPVSVHLQSGWGSVVACIIVLIACESLGMHLMLQMWSAKAAWIVTALDFYGMLWLIGDYHALRLRPTLIRPESIEVRHGLRWSATIDRSNIASIERVHAEAQWKRRGTLRLALLDEPQFLVRLHMPVVAKGLAGLKKSVDSIAFRPDDQASFLAALGPVENA